VSQVAFGKWPEIDGLEAMEENGRYCTVLLNALLPVKVELNRR
jgi:hypothetical protein